MVYFGVIVLNAVDRVTAFSLAMKTKKFQEIFLQVKSQPSSLEQDLRYYPTFSPMV